MTAWNNSRDWNQVFSESKTEQWKPKEPKDSKDPKEPKAYKNFYIVGIHVSSPVLAMHIPLLPTITFEVFGPYFKIKRAHKDKTIIERHGAGDTKIREWYVLECLETHQQQESHRIGESWHQITVEFNENNKIVPTKMYPDFERERQQEPFRKGYIIWGAFYHSVSDLSEYLQLCTHCKKLLIK